MATMERFWHSPRPSSTARQLVPLYAEKPASSRKGSQPKSRDPHKGFRLTWPAPSETIQSWMPSPEPSRCSKEDWAEQGSDNMDQEFQQTGGSWLPPSEVAFLARGPVTTSRPWRTNYRRVVFSTVGCPPGFPPCKGGDAVWSRAAKSHVQQPLARWLQGGPAPTRQDQARQPVEAPAKVPIRAPAPKERVRQAIRAELSRYNSVQTLESGVAVARDSITHSPRRAGRLARVLRRGSNLRDPQTPSTLWQSICSRS